MARYFSKKDIRESSCRLRDEPSNSMDLDAALHELGMLNRITDNRTDFLKEKLRKRCSNSFLPAPLCVVQMNSKFITKFSLSKNSHSHSDSEEEKTFELADTVSATYKVVESADFKRPSNRKFQHSDRYIRRQSRSFKPYEKDVYEKDASLRRMTQFTYIPTSTSDQDRASPPNMSRQDSGNKSNPSSPVKSQNNLTSPGSSIVRSRSLDDLEIGKLEDSKEDCYCYGRSEIETVSQRISKLHVS